MHTKENEAIHFVASHIINNYLDNLKKKLSTKPIMSIEVLTQTLNKILMPK